MRKTIALIFCGLIMLIGFQNCGKVAIAPPIEQNSLNTKSGVGYVCIPPSYTLETFFITNLNVKFTKAGIESDSDGDGLSDSEETSFGSNPLIRRTSGKILDSICKDVSYGVNCNNFNLSCNLSHNSLGLNECDILALNLNQSIATGVGLDSDKDGVPDYLEIRINSFPNLFDSYNDLDFDLLNTIVEGERNTSVRQSNVNMDEVYNTKILKTKIVNSTNCGAGEEWKIEIQNLPVLAAEAFSTNDSGSANYSRGTNQNIILTFMKVKPSNNPNGNAKVYSSQQLVDYDPQNLNRNFIFDSNALSQIGEVEQ
jgi:hypothetical protein